MTKVCKPGVSLCHSFCFRENKGQVSTGRVDPCPHPRREALKAGGVAQGSLRQEMERLDMEAHVCDPNRGLL